MRNLQQIFIEICEIIKKTNVYNWYAYCNSCNNNYKLYVIMKEERFNSLIKYYAEMYQLDWLLLKAQMKVENYFFNNGKRMDSEITPFYLGQLACKYHNEKLKDNLKEIIGIKAKYLSRLLKKFNGNKIKTFAAIDLGIYNSNELLIDNKNTDFVELIPKETHNYIIRIDKIYRKYKHKEYLNRIKKKNNLLTKV